MSSKKNQTLAAKRLKVKAQTIEYARDMQAQLEYQLLHARHEDTSALVTAYLETNKITRCKPAIYTKSQKRGGAMLGWATAGRHYLDCGKRHVYSK